MLPFINKRRSKINLIATLYTIQNASNANGHVANVPARVLWVMLRNKQERCSDFVKGKEIGYVSG